MSLAIRQSDVVRHLSISINWIKSALSNRQIRLDSWYYFYSCKQSWNYIVERRDIYKEREATVRYFIRYQTRGRRLSFIGSTIYESSISASPRSPFRRTTLAISSSRVTTSHSRSIQHCHIVAWSIKKWRTFFLAISIDTPNSILLYYFWSAGSRTIFIMSSAERDALNKTLLSCILLIIGSKASKLKWIEENKISWVAASNGKKWQCPNLFTREKRHHFTCLANEREWRNLNSAGEGETRNQLSRNPIENNPDLYYPIRSAREMKNATHSRVSQLI